MSGKKARALRKKFHPPGRGREVVYLTRKKGEEGTTYVCKEFSRHTYQQAKKKRK